MSLSLLYVLLIFLSFIEDTTKELHGQTTIWIYNIQHGVSHQKKYIQHGVKIIIIRHCHERIGRVTVVSLSDHTNINYRIDPKGANQSNPILIAFIFSSEIVDNYSATCLAWQNGLFFPLLYFLYMKITWSGLPRS